MRPSAVPLGEPTPPFLAPLIFEARKNVIAMFDGGVWGLVKLTGTAAPDVNTNRAESGRTWPQPSAVPLHTPRACAMCRA